VDIPLKNKTGIDVLQVYLEILTATDSTVIEDAPPEVFFPGTLECDGPLDGRTSVFTRVGTSPAPVDHRQSASKYLFHDSSVVSVYV